MGRLWIGQTLGSLHFSVPRLLILQLFIFSVAILGIENIMLTKGEIDLMLSTFMI